MNKYKIKSIAFSALCGMAILNSGAASCSNKEKSLKEKTDEELRQRITETKDELVRREEASEKDSSEKESEKKK